MFRGSIRPASRRENSDGGSIESRKVWVEDGQLLREFRGQKCGTAKGRGLIEGPEGHRHALAGRICRRVRRAGRHSGGRRDTRSRGASFKGPRRARAGGAQPRRRHSLLLALQGGGVDRRLQFRARLFQKRGRRNKAATRGCSAPRSGKVRPKKSRSCYGATMFSRSISTRSWAKH